MIYRITNYNILTKYLVLDLKKSNDVFNLETICILSICLHLKIQAFFTWINDIIWFILKKKNCVKALKIIAVSLMSRYTRICRLGVLRHRNIHQNHHVKNGFTDIVFIIQIWQYHVSDLEEVFSLVHLLFEFIWLPFY